MTCTINSSIDVNEVLDNRTAHDKALDKIVLTIKNLKVWYKTYRGDAKVVDGVNIYVKQGEKIGLVGESGCGKTTTVKTVLRTINPSQIKIPEGEILFQDRDILQMSSKQLMNIRRKHISMISQEPMAALNPVFTVGQQLKDIIKYSHPFKKISRKEIDELALKAIADVMIPDGKRILKSYPHQLSGGMRQRICIAMALVTPRDLLIADEPGTALDVTIQDQIHRLLTALVKQKGSSLIMITHSLGVARELVDRIYIMYAGNIVEVAETKDLFAKPSHPYTKGLIKCVPKLSGGGVTAGIYGYVPDYINPTKGCRFFPRCPDGKEICEQRKPTMCEVGEEHFVACWKYQTRV
jgi:peptide/nickel transport system ATP-binding protein